MKWHRPCLTIYAVGCRPYFTGPHGRSFVIAPATADIIGKIASGIADDMLSTTVMATKAPVLVVPSMNTQMYENPFVQENMEKLSRAGYTVMEPDAGHLACNTEGKGRFPKTEDILEEAEKILTGRRLFEGEKDSGQRRGHTGEN